MPLPATRGGAAGLTVAVSERISDDPVYAEIIADGDGSNKIQGFSYEKKSAYEWANVVYMPAKLMASGSSHMFEHIQKFLPANVGVIDRLEIDTLEDLRVAEKFLKSSNWFA